MLKKAHYFIAISIVIIITIAIIYSLASTDIKTETTDLSENAIHLDELTLGGQKLNIKPIRAIRNHRLLSCQSRINKAYSHL